jgi:DNA mismatch repair protein MSH4
VNDKEEKGFLECQTLALIQLNDRITDSYNEVIMLSDRVVQELLDAIRGHIPILFRVCEGIALLDMISAFAQSTTSRDYIRPELGDSVALKAARHPIYDAVTEPTCSHDLGKTDSPLQMMPQRYVPNDVFANEQHRFQIVTGCNMSGKSTYIRMIALMQIMAQIGCFVPAEYAAFPIIHQLFVRMSTDDSIEANMSTFSIEMREMAFILNNIDHKSIAIIDELGRATSTRDGLAIALAISEALIQSNALIWFATHFNQLREKPCSMNLEKTEKLTLR